MNKWMNELTNKQIDTHKWIMSNETVKWKITLNEQFSQNKDDLITVYCDTDPRRMASSILHSRWCVPGWSSVLWSVCLRRDTEVGWHSRFICSVQRWSVSCIYRRYAIRCWILWIKCNYCHLLCWNIISVALIWGSVRK